MSDPYPPIPPNCERFVKVGDHGYIWKVTPELKKHTSVTIAVYDPPPCWVPVIGADARGAWMDEADRILANKPLTLDNVIQITNAGANAEAWKLWGAQK